MNGEAGNRKYSQEKQGKEVRKVTAKWKKITKI
jgi:hypothetical protein